MSSVHAGLYGSVTLDEVFFGNLAVVASFMLFCLSPRDDVRPFRALRIDQYNHFTLQPAETDLASFAIILPPIFTGDSEIVQCCIAVDEVQPVVLDVLLSPGFVPSEYTILY
jgi:hypothetical protein